MLEVEFWIHHWRLAVLALLEETPQFQPHLERGLGEPLLEPKKIRGLLRAVARVDEGLERSHLLLHLGHVALHPAHVRLNELPVLIRYVREVLAEASTLILRLALVPCRLDCTGRRCCSTGATGGR